MFYTWIPMQISIEDVLRAIHLKSFDYRVLNLLLYQLRGEEVFPSFVSLGVNPSKYTFLFLGGWK